MKKILFILSLIFTALQAEELMFYDADNSCSLGCACSWDVLQPIGSIQLGKDLKINEQDDEIIFSKSIVVLPGSEIGFRLKGIEHNIAFTGFSIDTGSFNGKQDCARPKEYTIFVNNVAIKSGTLEDIVDRQNIVTDPVIVKNNDVVSIKFITGFQQGKSVGITYLTPNGGH